MAIVAAQKTVSFKSPYTGKTFQHLTESILGQDGYLTGGLASDNGGTISVTAFTFVQRGIIAEAVATTVPAPAGIEPWFLLAGTIDDSPTSGVVIIATSDLRAAADSVVIAMKYAGIWENPAPVSVKGGWSRPSEAGIETGFSSSSTVVATDVTSIVVNTGEVVDPDGVRRRPGVRTGAQLIDLSPVRADSINDREDFIVRRKLDARMSETRHLLGGHRGTSPATVLQDDVVAKRPHYYAKRGGTEKMQWWAWGVGNALRVKGGTSAGNLAFAAATLLTGAGTILETFIVGQRATDSRVVILYVDGANLRMVSINEATGAQVEAPVTIDTQANQISHVRAVWGANDVLHVVYEHDEGPAQQIYHTRVRAAVIGFGTHVLTPRIVNGSDTGRNDTWPSIGMNRQGEVTISYITGLTGDEFGDLVVATLTDTGTVTSWSQLKPATDAATTDLTNFEEFRSFTTESFDDFRRTAVVVTEHDEVYVFTIGTRSSTGNPDNILVYNPQFGAQYGNQLLMVTSTTAPVTIDGIAAASGEQGQVELYMVAADPAGTYHTLLTLNTEFFRDGIHEDRSVVYVNLFALRIPAEGFNDPLLARGTCGDFQAAYLAGTAATTTACASVGTIPIDRHPLDVYLAQWEVYHATTGTLPGNTKQFGLVHPRPKRMNYPFLVGDYGDYQGFNALPEALVAARRTRGEIVIRPGRYLVPSAFTVPSGVSIRGEGVAYLDCGSTQVTLGGGGVVTTGLAVAGNIVQFPGFSTIAAGDLINITGAGGTGWHTVVRNLGRVTGTVYAVLVENNILGTPPGPAVPVSIAVYYAGIRVENLILRGTVSDSYLLSAKGCWQPQLRNLRLEGQHTTPGTPGVVTIDNCYNALVDQMNFKFLFDTLDTYRTISVTGGDGTTLRGIQMTDIQGSIFVGNDAANVHLISCHGDGTDATKVVYDIESGRTTPVFMTDCEGRGAGDVGFLITNVGQRVRLPEGGGSLAFEDDNTRASTITDDGIKLSSSGQKQFDGVSPDVITDAVNERLLADGGAMTNGTIATTAITGGTVAGAAITGGTMAGTDVSGGSFTAIDDLAVVGNISVIGDLKHATRRLNISPYVGQPVVIASGDPGGWNPAPGLGMYSKTSGVVLYVPVSLRKGDRITGIGYWLQIGVAQPGRLNRASVLAGPVGAQVEMTNNGGDGNTYSGASWQPFDLPIDIADWVTFGDSTTVTILFGASDVGVKIGMITVFYDHP